MHTSLEDVKPGRLPVIKYVSLWNNRCGLSIEPKRNILRAEGTENVKEIRNATAKDVAWVRAMGGHVPRGRVAIARALGKEAQS